MSNQTSLETKNKTAKKLTNFLGIFNTDKNQVKGTIWLFYMFGCQMTPLYEWVDLVVVGCLC